MTSKDIAYADVDRIIDIIQRAYEIEADDTFIQEVRDFVDDPVAGLRPEAMKFVNRAVSGLKETLAKYDAAKDKEMWRDYLDASYAELFLAASANAIAPQESVYLGNDKVMYDKPYFEVVEFSRQYGWAKPANFYEPDDHIAMEWKFFQYLFREGANSDEHFDAAMKFKAEHMDKWMADALRTIVEVDDMGFYTGMANLTRAVLVELY